MGNKSEPKLEAYAFQQVLNRQTKEVVGYRYRWNNGSVQTLWSAGRVNDVIYLDLPAASADSSQQNTQRSRDS